MFHVKHLTPSTRRGHSARFPASIQPSVVRLANRRPVGTPSLSIVRLRPILRAGHELIGRDLFGGRLYYLEGWPQLGPAFAAVCAGIAALLEATTASRYHIAGSSLEILLVFAVAVTVVFGFEAGMAWAFAGGLMADFLALRPLGSTVFELLVVVGLTDVSVPVLSRARYPGCILAVFVLTPIYLVVADAVAALLQPSAPTLQPSALVVAALVNAVVAAIATPPVIGLKRRAEQRERVLWWR